jgi:hypothetical protein
MLVFKQRLRFCIIFIFNMPAKRSSGLPTSAIDSRVTDPEAHKKLKKRIYTLSLTEYTEGSEASKRLYDGLCILTGSSVGGTADVPLVPMLEHERQRIYPKLSILFKNVSGNLFLGTARKLFTHTFYPYLKIDENGKDIAYCSILHVGPDIRMARGGGPLLNFYCLLKRCKSIAVILIASLESSLQSPLVDDYADENGLMQEFNTCAFCGGTGPSVHLCKCLEVAYCNRSCQSGHWSEHKAVCKQRPQKPLDLSDLSSSISSIKVDVCVVCGASGSLKTCKCKTLYCSSVCQTSDWPTHKALCKTLRKNLPSALKSSHCSRCMKDMDPAGAAGAICSKCATG